MEWRAQSFDEGAAAQVGEGTQQKYIAGADSALELSTPPHHGDVIPRRTVPA